MSETNPIEPVNVENKEVLPEVEPEKNLPIVETPAEQLNEVPEKKIEVNENEEKKPEQEEVAEINFEQAPPVDSEQPIEEQKTSELQKKTIETSAKTQLSQKEKQKISQDLKKKQMEEQFQENKKAEEALKSSKIILSVECCINCFEHQYCTHHKEEKYQEFMKLLKIDIEKENPEIHVCKNYKINKPRIGALEVQFKDQMVYSKLKEMKWPNSITVGRKIRAIIEKEKEDAIKAEIEATKKAELEEIQRQEAEEKKRQMEEMANKIAEEKLTTFTEDKVEIEIEKKNEILPVEEKENIVPETENDEKFADEPMSKFEETQHEEDQEKIGSKILQSRDLNQEMPSN